MYDPDYIASFYDQYGEREWERLGSTPANRVNFHVHRWYMEQFINAGDRVLDIGCGPGRFSIELVRLGARVTAADISPKQLELHRNKMHEAGCEHRIEDRHLLDVVDLSSLRDASFDGVVCYGGPLSYVFDRFDDALSELLRVTRPGGYVLCSVMSREGTTRHYFPFVKELIDLHGVELIQKVIDTGDLVGEVAGEHQCRMYRWADLQRLLAKHPCTIEAASAANFLALGNEESVEQMAAKDPSMWDRFLEWEIEACRQPGAIDGGTHIIVVLRKDS